MEEFLLVYAENLMCFAMFFVNFPRRQHFAARFTSFTLLGACGAYVFDLVLPDTVPVVFVYYVGEFCALLLIFYYSFRISWGQALGCASAGRATQHLIYQILQLISLWYDPSESLSAHFWTYLFWAVLSYVPFCLASYLAFARKIGPIEYNDEKGEFRGRIGALSAITILVCVGITRLVKTDAGRSQTTFIAESLYAIICCILCLGVQFELNRQIQLTGEMEMIRLLWKKDSEQLAERRDTIEMINIKCHDIRHKLEDYRLPLAKEEGEEVDSLIRIYDQSYRTGNPTLDVLLTDRAFLCGKDHIQMSFMGDGKALDFLTEREVFSLFSNAIENAIEASRRVEEERRQISILVKGSGDLVSINVRNYYQGELVMEKGLPVTTRPDDEGFHGYGMKSMQAIAEEHGGSLEVAAQDGVFDLTIWMVKDGTRT